jgi:hypothetical protein
MYLLLKRMPNGNPITEAVIKAIKENLSRKERESIWTMLIELGLLPSE